MSTPTVQLSSGIGLKWFSGNDVVHFNFKAHPLIFFSWPNHGTGAVIELPLTGMHEVLAAALSEVRSASKPWSGPTVVKFLSAVAVGAQLEKALDKAGFRITAKIVDDTSFEGFFYAATNRLRVAPPQAKKPVRVLVVDDSKTMCNLLKRVLSADSVCEVVGVAERPSQVTGLLEKLRPDVMTLDINMPEMSGVELLRQLLPTRFVPTVMISALGLNEGREVLNALEIGAVDYIQKPSAHEIEAMIPVIQQKILAAAQYKRRAPTVQRQLSPRRLPIPSDHKLIAVGASTGGTEAIKSLFMQLPENVPPIAVVQHIPRYFSTAFANRLNELCAFEVREAQDGDELRQGLALVAPGGLQMEIVRSGGKLQARLVDSEPVNRFKPSVDVLFKSVASAVGRDAIGILLTGMGDDGARGLLAMREKGSHTIAQDEGSCVVFGMPRAAIEIGAAEDVCPLDSIADVALRWAA